MPVVNSTKVSTPIDTVSPMASNTTTAIQSGPYTKAQFQSTIEGSRTIKSSKEVEYRLRDYPAALELYRTGKYKVKVKCDAEVERVILVEKRITKVAANTLPTATPTPTNDNQENNQTVPDLSTNSEESKEVKKNEIVRRSRSRTHSQDRAAQTALASSGNTTVHGAISSIRMTSNTQPKVDHHRTPSRDRDVSATPSQQQQNVHGRSQSRDNQNKAQYGKHVNREYPKMMVPFVPPANNPGNLWQQKQQQQQQQQRLPQPYFSNPLLQQQQQRSNLYMPAPFMPQQNSLYRQPYYYGPRPSVPVVYPQQQAAYLAPSARSIGKPAVYSTNNYASSTRPVSNTMGLPPTFRTFHSNQQPISSLHPMYPAQVPLPMNNPWAHMSNEPVSALTNNNGTPIEQPRGAKNRARSVDTGPRNNALVYPFNVQPQPAPMVKHHHHHHQRHKAQTMNNTFPMVENVKEENVSAKEPTNTGNIEKLTVRQLNETFMKEDPSGRVPYNSLPGLVQRFGITLTENDVVSAAKDLEYNVNEPISARRFVHVLVKLGKITKSTQQQSRPPASPSMLPEDREVTDILAQRKAAAAAAATHMASSLNQPNQWV